MKTLFSSLMSMVVLAACTSPSVSQSEQASKSQVQTQQTAQLTLAAKWRVVASINSPKKIWPVLMPIWI